MLPSKTLILTISVIIISSFAIGWTESGPAAHGLGLRPDELTKIPASQGDSLSTSGYVRSNQLGLPYDSPDKSIEFVGSLGGPIKATVVANNFAFVGEGTRLTVLEVSVPNDPLPLSHLQLNGAVSDILVDGTHVYVANEDQGLQIVDVNDMFNPILQGVYPIQGKPEALYLDGGRVYIAAGQAGLFIIDVADPANPALLGKYVGLVTDVWVQGTNAFIVNGDFAVLNVTDPSNPTLTSSYSTPEQARAVQIVGSKSFVADGSTLLVLDISDPLDPVQLSSYANDWPIHYIEIEGESAYLLYTVDRLPFLDPTWSCNLKLVDIANPDNPSFLGEYVRDSYAPEACDGSVRVINDRAYLANGDLQVIDVGDPTLPGLLGSYLAVRPAGIWVADNFAYLADQERGLLIIDLSDPLRPALRGIYEHKGIFDVQVVGGTAFAASREPSTAHFPSGNLLVIDVSDPSDPVLSSEYTALVLDMEIKEGWAYIIKHVAGFSPVLTILDVRDPYNPEVYLDDYRIVPSSSRLPGLQIVTAAGRFVYATDSSTPLETFYVLDASAPWSPIIRGSLPLGGNLHAVSQMRVIANYAYIASGDNGMKILDLSDADHPEIAGAYDTPGQTLDLQIVADMAYLADGAGGVQIVDVSDRSNPTLLANYAPIFAQAIQVEGDTIYVVDGAGSLTVLRYASSSSASISTAGGDLVSVDDTTSYQFSPGTFTVPVNVTHTIRSIINLPATGDLKNIGHNFALKAEQVATGLPVQPSQPCTITIGYTDEQRGPVVENTLALYFWDGGQWIQEPTSLVHPDTHTITASPDHFSLWAVLGEVNRFFAPLVSTRKQVVFYRVFGQRTGWMSWVPGVDTAADVTQDQQLEAIQIHLSNPPTGMEIAYQVHLENIGWMDWVSDGQVAGLPGSDLRLEAIRIKLTNAPSGYAVAYQANVDGLGWMEGVFDGETAGTTGQSRRMQAIRVQIIAP
jgi:hypothetical protein